MATLLPGAPRAQVYGRTRAGRFRDRWGPEQRGVSVHFREQSLPEQDALKTDHAKESEVATSWERNG